MSSRLPAVTGAAVVVMAFWALGVLGAAALPVTDPDTWWHIRAGHAVLDTGRVPHTDTWSIAGAGREWTSQDWLSNVAMAAIHSIGAWGPTLLSITYAAIVVAAVALLWCAVGARRPAIGWLARVAWLLLGIMLAAPVLGARVQVIDLLLAAAAIAVLWEYMARPRSLRLVALPVIAVAWVNLHAGFPLLFLLGGAVVVGEALDRLTSRRIEGEPLAWSQLGWLTVALLAAAAALVANPNGVAIYAYPFQTLGIGALSSFVGEWQPARISAPAGQLLAAFVILGVVPTLALGWRSLRTADALVLVGLTLMAAIAVRFLLLAGPIGAVVVCLNLAPIVSGSRLGQSVARSLTRLETARGGARGALNLALAAAVAAIGIGVTGLRVLPDAQAHVVAKLYPAAALDWMAEHRPGERVFNRYEWGGYLGLRLPDRPIFIDGRADLYGDLIIREYVETISVNDDPQALFDRYRIDHIVFPTNTTLGRWLDASDAWESVYADGVASVWVAR